MAVLAIALSAILAGMARYTDNAAYLNEKTMALLVAHNRLTSRAGAGLAGHRQERRRDGNGRSEMALGRRSHRHAPDPNLRRVDIRVQAPRRKGNAATVSSFVSTAGRK